MPQSLARLYELEELILNSNEIVALPEEIGSLRQLRRLDINNNQLTSLPDSIDKLTELTYLDVSNNQLDTLPTTFGSLGSLAALDLAVNTLISLPDRFGELSSLRVLTAKSNRLSRLPNSFGSLRELVSADLSFNRLTALPGSIAGLRKLATLYLGSNQLLRLPNELGDLRELRDLNVKANRLNHLPLSVRTLTRLRSADVSYNALSTLPPGLSELTELESFNCEGNPLNPELNAAASAGMSALQDYLARIDQEGEPLYEAKLLFVGEGEVGKSSLLATLRGEPWNENRDSTHGIQVKPLNVPHPTLPTDIVLNGWDFGGQPLYRPTHQLFFSAPALYLVVWKPRESPEQGFVDYWIGLIKSRVGSAARILVVATHRDKRRLAHIDETTLQATYGEQLVGFFHVDSQTGEGISKLRIAIASAAAMLPEMGRPYPRSWRRAREAIAAAQTPYLMSKPFESLLLAAGLDQSSVDAFSRNSHELGHLIHYADDPGLADLVVLRPDWLSRAISYVLEDRNTVDAHGLVRHDWLTHIWNDPNRSNDERHPPTLHPMLLRLMERFDISYRVATVGSVVSELSLIGQLVPPTATLEDAWEKAVPSGRDELTETIELVDADTGRPRLPVGLLYQLIVRLHRFSLGRTDHRNAVHWQAGVVLDDDYNGRALIQVTPEGIRVTVRAAYPHFFMHQLTEEIRWLVTGQWLGLVARRKVPCGVPCGLGSPGTGLFDIERLVRERERGTVSFPCATCDEWQLIDSLLLGRAGVENAGVNDAQLVSMSGQIRELSGRLAAGLERQERQFEELLSRSDEQISVLLAGLDNEGEHGPRLLTLLPIERGWRKPGWLSLRFRLTLFCEHSHLPIHLLDGVAASGVYDIAVPRELVVAALPILRRIVDVLGVLTPLQRVLGPVAVADDVWSGVQANIEAASSELVALSEVLGGESQGPLGLKEVDVQVPSDAVLRRLHTLLRARDPGYGGLEKVRTSRREVLWVHPRFVELYRPSPPAI